MAPSIFAPASSVLQAPIVAGGGVELAVGAMQQFSDVADIQVTGAGVLNNLSGSGQFDAEVQAGGALEVCLAALRKFTDKLDVQRAVCGAIMNMSCGEVSAEVVWQGGAELLLSACTRWGGDRELLRLALGALENITFVADNVKSVMESETDPVPLCIDVMMRFDGGTEDEDVQEAALGVLFRLADPQHNNGVALRVKQAIIDGGGIDLANRAVERYGYIPSHEWYSSTRAERCLSWLLCLPPPYPLTHPRARGREVSPVFLSCV
jgi:hypothetical protein